MQRGRAQEYGPSTRWSFTAPTKLSRMLSLPKNLPGLSITYSKPRKSFEISRANSSAAKVHAADHVRLCLPPSRSTTTVSPSSVSCRCNGIATIHQDSTATPGKRGRWGLVRATSRPLTWLGSRVFYRWILWDVRTAGVCDAVILCTETTDIPQKMTGHCRRLAKESSIGAWHFARSSKSEARPYGTYQGTLEEGGTPE